MSVPRLSTALHAHLHETRLRIEEFRDTLIALKKDAEDDEVIAFTQRLIDSMERIIFRLQPYVLERAARNRTVHRNIDHG